EPSLAQQGGLVAEGRVHGLDGDAGTLCDLGDRSPPVTLLDEQIMRCAQDPEPGLVRLLVAARGVVLPLDGLGHRVHPHCIENSVTVSEVVMTSETEEFLAEMLPKQRAAEQALHNGKVAPRLALWSRNDPLTVYGARLSVSGWADIEPTFHTVASWFSDSTEFEFEVIAA